MAVLSITSLTKRFGRLLAVDGLSLDVERGDVFGLLGPNGSGKTTTLACALGLMRPDAGTVRVLDRPAERIHETRGRVGAVFDDASLVPGLTARANLEYARRLLGHEGGRGVDEALALVAMTDHADRRAGRLSLGQTRRVAIARALLGRPELLVLDEPLSGLDTVGVGTMLALLTRLREDGLTLVLSSHRLHEMERVVGRVAMIVDGRLVREGPLDAIVAEREGRVHVEATPLARARETLHAHDEVETLHTEGGTLVVTTRRGDVAALVAALVGAGCAVHAVRPERVSLLAAFEDAVERARAHSGTAGAAP